MVQKILRYLESFIDVTYECDGQTNDSRSPVGLGATWSPTSKRILMRVSYCRIWLPWGP